jgi:hypothetical protein
MAPDSMSARWTAEQFTAFSHAFDGCDLALADVGGKRQARPREVAIDKHSASAADAVIASALGAGQIQV